MQKKQQILSWTRSLLGFFQMIFRTIFLANPIKNQDVREGWLSFQWGHCSFLMGRGAHKVLSVPSRSVCPQTQLHSSHMSSSKVMLKILQASCLWGLTQLDTTEPTQQQQASIVHEPRTSRCLNWIQKRHRNQRSNCQHLLDHRKRKSHKNIYFCFIDYAKAFDRVDYNKLWKILKEMGIPDHLTCLLRNLYADQEATVRTGHGTTDWFQTAKGVRQGCILSPCLFNLYAEYIMRNGGWNKHKLESRLPGEMSITSDMQKLPLLWQKVKRN